MPRPTSPIPAIQLKSVAGRFRGRGDGPSVSASLRRVWQEASSEPTSSSAPVEGDRCDEKTTRLEAVLFLAREPLNSRKLSQYANLADGTEARTLIRRLNGVYDRTGRSFRVEQVAGGYMLLSRPQFASWLRRLGHVPQETRLSTPAMETLAVVAYRQPVLRADIEAIRGVSCGEILRQLMERDLVRIGGRSDELGRPYLYATTKKFLQTFGLAGLESLPRAESLRIGGAGTAIETTIAQSTQNESTRNESTQNESTQNESILSSTLMEPSRFADRAEEETDVTVKTRVVHDPETVDDPADDSPVAVAPRMPSGKSVKLDIEDEVEVEDDDDDDDDWDDDDDDDDDVDDDDLDADDAEDDDADDDDDDDDDDWDDDDFDDDWEEVEDEDEEEDDAEEDDDDWDDDDEEDEDDWEEED